MKASEMILQFMASSIGMIEKLKASHEARGENIPDDKLWVLIMCRLIFESLKYCAGGDNAAYMKYKKHVSDRLDNDKLISDFLPEFIHAERRYADYQFYKLICDRLYSYATEVEPRTKQMAQAIAKTPKYRALREIYISNAPNVVRKFFKIFITIPLENVDIDQGINPGWS